jgi:hypothetical protein
MNKLLLSASLLLVSTFSFAAYEDHFPTYFEYCTGTQWKLQSGEKGGVPGHGLTYIHGLCKDYSSEYPQVIPCDEIKDKSHSGVGISLDKNFSNVMWVAIPGRDLTFFGDKERKAISQDDIKEQINKVTKLKVFNEVKSKSEFMAQFTYGTQEYLEAIARDTVGTDHAVNWARELHCVKVPFPKNKLTNLAKILNDSNNQYKTGPGYNWDKLNNNCVHLSINQSAALGINKSIKLDQKYISMLFNMALPAHGFLMYADLAVLKKSPSAKALKKSLETNGFHPVQVGSIMETYEAYPSGEYFNTEDLTVLTLPRLLRPWRLLGSPKKYEKKYMTLSNSDLKANAKMWRERYETMLSKLDQGEASSELGSYLQNQIELAQKIAAEE